MARTTRGHRYHVNVTLRALETADGAWLDSWLPTVAASVAYERVDALASAASLLEQSRAERRLRVQIIERDGAAAGITIVRVHEPRRGAAMIELIATPRENARRGSGMTAAVLLEQQLLSAGVRAIYAPAAAIHGISMYFWIRLGYRPLLRDEWPCRLDGVAWLTHRI